MKNPIGALSVLGLVVLMPACSTTMQNPDEEAGYFLPQKQAQARGGVANYVDREKRSPRSGTEPQALSLEDRVFFDPGSSELRSDAQDTLSKLGQSLSQDPQRRIRLIGRTDDLGLPGYNQKLSLRRAEAVRDALRQQGAKAEQIIIVAKGERDPLVPNRDDQSRAQNRSVEVFQG